MYEILVSVNILVEMDIVTCTGRRLEQPLAGNERHTSFFIIYYLLTYVCSVVRLYYILAYKRLYNTMVLSLVAFGLVFLQSQ